MMVSNDHEVTVETNFEKPSKVLQAIAIAVVLVVSSVPVAIEVVCKTSLAMGSHRMAERKVIVARLSAIEELAGEGRLFDPQGATPRRVCNHSSACGAACAGMTVLCSDKTGTLTQNKLSLSDPVLFQDMPPEELVFYAALACNHSSNQDAIDLCITQSMTPNDK